MTPIDATTTTAQVQSTGAFSIEVYADKTFDAASGRTVIRGDLLNENYCAKEVCTLVDEVLGIPVVNLEPTENGVSDQTATYSAYIREEGQQPVPFLLKFPVPPLYPGQSALTWPWLRLHKAGVKAVRDNETYTKQQVDALIALALANLISAGVAAGTGSATLVAGTITVDTALVTAASKIILTAQDGNTSGSLSAQNRVNGVSFDIVASDGGSTGVVAWFLFN